MQGISVSLIFPIYNLHGERLRNFNFNLARAQSAQFSEIIVIEQVRSAEQKPGFKIPQKVRYIPIISDCEVIEKSRLVNLAVQSSHSDYIWVNDADIYAPFSQVIESIKSHHIVIKPFKYFVKLEIKETAEFISKRRVTTQSSYIDGLCAGAFIARKAEFIKVRGMDERFQGWGYEDMELALRLQQVFPIESFNQFRGVHLNHPKDTGKQGTDFTARNLDLYGEAKRIIAEDVFEQINRIRSPFNKNIEWLSRRGKAIHIVSPAMNSKNPLFLHRQMLAFSSINRADYQGITKIAAFTSDEYLHSEGNSMFTEWQRNKLTRDALDIGHSRPLPYIKDLLDVARRQAEPEDFLILTNADCGITSSFYKNILSITEDYIEFFRVNVLNPHSVEDLWSNNPSKTTEEKDGIDGFAIRAVLYDEVRDKIPDLLIGEPYWDPVISGIFKHRASIIQNIHDLRHTEHSQEWSLLKLSIGGEHNKACWQAAFDEGLLDIRKCEIVSDTVVIRVHRDNESNYKSAAQAFRKLRSQDLYVNHVLIDIVKDRQESNLRDDALGTTGGKRVIHEWQELSNTYTEDEVIANTIDKCSGARFIILLDAQSQTEDTALLRKVVQQLREQPDRIIQMNSGLKSDTTNKPEFLLRAMTKTKFKSLRSFKESNLKASDPDTAVIIATFGDDKLRTAANVHAFQQLQRQSLKVKYVWMELLNPGQSSQLPLEIRNNSNLQHVILEAKPSNARLFQKEAMWNRAVRELPKSIKFFFFFDSDIYCDKNNWYAKIRELLDFDNSVIVQPGTEVITLKVGENPEITRVQLTFTGYEDLRPSKQPYNFNPGLAVCMTRKMFESLGGFNPYGVMYGGDTIFLIETNKASHQYYKYLMNQSSMRHILRRDVLNRKDIKIRWRTVDNYITHVWHGDETNRTYWIWEHFLTTIDFNAAKCLHIDENGLLAWREEYPLFNYVFDRRSNLVDKSVCRKLIREFYDDSEQSATIKTAFSPGNFAVDVWTLNVRREPGEIPWLNEAGEQFLRLQGELQTRSTSGFVSVISFAPHFTPIDVTQIAIPYLVIDLRSDIDKGQNILIALQSKEDEVENAQESPRVSLANYGEIGAGWTTYRIPLSDMSGVNLTRLTSVVIKGNAEFTIDIRSLKIEV